MPHFQNTGFFPVPPREPRVRKPRKPKAPKAAPVEAPATPAPRETVHETLARTANEIAKAMAPKSSPRPLDGVEALKAALEVTRSVSPSVFEGWTAEQIVTACEAVRRGRWAGLEPVRTAENTIEWWGDGSDCVCFSARDARGFVVTFPGRGGAR